MTRPAHPARGTMDGPGGGGPVEQQAYADTAAVAYAARRDLSGVDAPGAPPMLPPRVALFFAPNATRCLADVVEFVVRRRGFALHPWHAGTVHPVVERALAPLAGGAGDRTVQLVTAMDWVTGEYRGVTSVPGVGADLVVIDAVQCFGNLDPAELGEVWRVVRDGAVVVGCIHKWIGGAVPVGFAALPVRLLADDPELRAWLAARDYLGDAAGDRPGFDLFPDTYSRSLAPVVREPLRLALGNDAGALASRVSVIAQNRATLRELLARSAYAPTIREPAQDACRAIVALGGRRAHLAPLSGRLLREGFTHTVLSASVADAILRLSAPAVPVTAGVWARFQAALEEA